MTDHPLIYSPWATWLGILPVVAASQTHNLKTGNGRSAAPCLSLACSADNAWLLTSNDGTPKLNDCPLVLWFVEVSSCQVSHTYYALNNNRTWLAEHTLT